MLEIIIIFLGIVAVATLLAEILIKIEEKNRRK